MDGSVRCMMAEVFWKKDNVRRLGDVAAFENRQTVTVAKFINKSSLFILLPGVISRLKLKLKSELKVEHLFVAPPYCQTVVSRFSLS